MLNNSFQRLPDNAYYQRFSYALRSLIPIDTWGDTVKSLSHVAGFDRFSDLDIESKDPMLLLLELNQQTLKQLLKYKAQLKLQFILILIMLVK